VGGERWEAGGGGDSCSEHPKSAFEASSYAAARRARDEAGLARSHARPNCRRKSERRGRNRERREAGCITYALVVIMVVVVVVVVSTPRFAPIVCKYLGV